MLLDTRIIQRHGAHAVLAQRLAIHWPDHSTIGLHPVRLRGRDERYLRALQYDPLLWLVVDLRELAPSLAAEILALPWRDTDGLVLHTLRLRYSHADALRARAVTCFKAGWAALPGLPPRLKAVPAGRMLDAACWQRSGAGAMRAHA
jgi:hypothetical protein